ncbi:hypothetical protein E4V01_15630 [Methylorubrum sp. Q1]|uniref:hypothetical protein n=1 Tax=Methylorubrum sp. Q1 TaxID=2562453 RepID=UPI0011019E4B|nr:hypothetical protein [Methylorubrum sp. Q1]TFZ57365.1 hypothetical protein E4V01_15630 [Methylorubrum sp. Q1]
MMITISAEDFATLSAQTQAELLAQLQGIPAPTVPQSEKAYAPSLPSDIDPALAKMFDWEDRADLTFKQIQTWMLAASDKTKLGLKVFAEHGPIIDVSLLHEVGIENPSHFQSRTTMRTRTVTGDTSAFMLAWSDWSVGDCRYAVTPITHQSLRRYFNLD